MIIMIFDVLWEMFYEKIIGMLINIVRKQILISINLFDKRLG